MERIFEAYPAQGPCDKQGHLQLNQVIQGPIQPDLEYFQE